MDLEPDPTKYDDTSADFMWSWTYLLAVVLGLLAVGVAPALDSMLMHDASNYWMNIQPFSIHKLPHWLCFADSFRSF